MIAGFEGRYPWILAGSIALRLVGFIDLIPFFGLMGAAMAATLSLLIMTVTMNVLCRRWTGIDPSVLAVVRKFRRSRMIAAN
jgi:hypothetical protein